MPPQDLITVVTINILDANDNYPEFSQAGYFFSAREDLAVGQPIGSVTKMRYLASTVYLGNRSRQWFFECSIDTVYQALELMSLMCFCPATRTINYNETPNNQGFFVLTVEATDADQPPQKTNTTITVSIIDENNHDPIFAPTVYSGSISEIAPRGKNINSLQWFYK
ncbi:FAT1_2_3 [Mytilus coruscus]|uniref:FAT1_2_3 n=1 Tax=Mytilus coruscus TaxID=42192 RepID=A0A6J8E1X4_MYTCO|nr:FAT1_2_3 [Mytilus coruscus]